MWRCHSSAVPGSVEGVAGGQGAPLSTSRVGVQCGSKGPTCARHAGSVIHKAHIVMLWAQHSMWFGGAEVWQ